MVLDGNYQDSYTSETTSNISNQSCGSPLAWGDFKQTDWVSEIEFSEFTLQQTQQFLAIHR